MHSHDQTMLAKLGFNDPDRKDPLHDLASQYLALPHNAERILRMCEWGHLLDQVAFDHPDGGFHCWGRPEETIRTWEGRHVSPAQPTRFYRPPPQLEKIILKGSERYQTTVGFADLYLDPVVVEVKIARCSVSDLMRQLSLYRLHLHPHCPIERYYAAAAVAFDVSAGFVQSLETARIKLVRLGPKFRQWAAEQQAAPSTMVDEI